MDAFHQLHCGFSPVRGRDGAALHTSARMVSCYSRVAAERFLLDWRTFIQRRRIDETSFVYWAGVPIWKLSQWRSIWRSSKDQVLEMTPARSSDPSSTRSRSRSFDMTSLNQQFFLPLRPRLRLMKVVIASGTGGSVDCRPIDAWWHGRRGCGMSSSAAASRAGSTSVRPSGNLCQH
jgi:hypothetical protein